MKLLVATDAHIFMTPDGKHWCKNIYGYDFWKRYLEVFEDIKIVSRVKYVNVIEGKNFLVDGEHVEVFGIPFYQGPIELLKNYIKIQKCLKDIDKDCDAVLLRMPSQTASMVYSHLKKNIPIAGEIVYNMMDDVKLKHQNIMLKVLNIIISNNLKKFCLNANGVAYVTEHSIQKYYPSHAMLHGQSQEYFDTFYSTITLSDTAFTGPRKFSYKNKLKIALSSVSMNSERKGEKVVIETVKKARDRGYDISAIIIGDGILRQSFEDYAQKLGVSKFIEFTGLLPSSEDVRKVMMQTDIFVFPTQGEGLPRGILEAMAIGLPVLSTSVGGISEIIKEKYLFDPLDSDSFANEICRLHDNIQELNQMSEENFKKSLMFKNELLQKKRIVFYKKVKYLAQRFQL